MLLIATSAIAQHKHDKGLGAHEHGAIKLEIAIEGKTIEISLDGPAESFIGFEYTPKTDKEKKIFKDAEALWTKNILTKLFVLDKKMECMTSNVSFVQEIEGTHSDIEAEAKIICAQDLKGQKLIVALRKYYPHIKKLSIDVMGSESKSYNKAKITEEIQL